MRPVLHLVGCGSRPTSDLPEFAATLRAAGWDSYVITSPTGRRFLDIDKDEQHLGRAVRWEFDPDDPAELPPAQAVAVAPATFNTITKLAAGIADTLALAVAAEALGAGLPVIVVPWTNTSLAGHPQYGRSVQILREWGVQILAAEQSQPFPWALLRRQLERVHDELISAAAPNAKRTTL